ncbi:MAG: BON domain-containing protein [Chroococcidiopsidaceae cyanobacterium CP_BM_ER_R8_30]|nr:BON domain-containing protein [Chroococcidiopsidaceae cyanobacterium CP_BM_ER_R8_30]
MGWLQRLFGLDRPPENAQVNPDPASDPNAASGDASAATAESSDASIPPERVGLNGEYDQSGLAKRVALAFDQDPSLQDIETVYVAQTGGTVVLKGEAPSQEILDQMVSVASGVSGATNVATDQVTVG